MKRPLFLVVCVLAMLSACDDGNENTSPLAVGPMTREDTLFVLVPGGSFTNSSGLSVNVETFSLMACEVTNRFYAGAAQAARVEMPPDPRFPGVSDYVSEMPGHPVVNVSPDEASRVAAALGLRLPTQDEWEYAASRGLTGDIGSQFVWGRLTPEEAPGIPGNYLALGDWEQRDADGFPYTAPVGSYPLSQAGFADLAGNVAEIVLDDSSFVLKGGSWAQDEDAMTIGWYRVFASGDRCWYAGFRFAR